MLSFIIFFSRFFNENNSQALDQANVRSLIRELTYFFFSVLAIHSLYPGCPRNPWISLLIALFLLIKLHFDLSANFWSMKLLKFQHTNQIVQSSGEPYSIP